MVYVCKVAVETTFINSLILLFNLQENMKISMFSICKINTIVFHKNCDFPANTGIICWQTTKMLVSQLKSFDDFQKLKNFGT